jgi:uncharacterized LabA/DUF88 family protein
MRSHCAIYVDVGYLLAAAATRVTGTSLRRGVQVDHPELIRGLIERAEGDSGLPLLRVNWYDSGARPGGMPDFVQDEIGLLPRVKLRLGRLSHAGEQKGVDLRIGLDLATHGRNRVVDVIYLVSGDDDLTEAVEEAQGHGVQVILLAVPGQDDRPHGVARHLQRAADGLILLDGETIDRAVRSRAIPEALIPDEHKPDTDEPAPAGAQPDHMQPDQTEADPTLDGAAAAASVSRSVSEAAVPDSSVPDSSVPASSVPDSSVPASSVPAPPVTAPSVPDPSLPAPPAPAPSVPARSVPAASVPDPSVPDPSVPGAAAPESPAPDRTGSPKTAAETTPSTEAGREPATAAPTPTTQSPSRDAVAAPPTPDPDGAATRSRGTDEDRPAAGAPETAPTPSPTPSLFAKKKATALVPPPDPARTSAAAVGTGTHADAGLDLEVIDVVARQVIRSWCTTATPQLLAELKEQRPSIPGDLDRAMLVDLSNRSGHYDIDEGSRHELRSRFWHLVDQIRLS